MIGVRRLIRSISSSVSVIPHSCARAGKCNAMFVDPPVAAAIVTAFSNASRVMMSRARIFFSSKRITCLPDSTANASRSTSTAGGEPLPGNAIPIASAAQAIVLAVNCPPQLPADGHAPHSIS